MKVKLIHMEDPFPLATGTIGTVINVDCNGDLEVAWENGSSLKLIPSVDRFQVISEDNQKKEIT